MRVECIYLTNKESYFIALTVEEGAAIKDVIQASGVLEQYSELELEALNVGVFGEKKNLMDVVRQGDRVEIYRPLLINPMEARRSRAIAPKKSKRKTWKIVVI